jgi:hypothetical protein
MLKKFLLSITLLGALSVSAQAGSTISDKSYWPSEARQTTQAATAVSRRDANSAFAYDRSVSESLPSTSAGGSAWRYQGGPKSH